MNSEIAEEQYAAADTIYHYDAAGHLIAEADGSGKVSRECFWLDGTAAGGAAMRPALMNGPHPAPEIRTTRRL